jgi:hypothetical protein
VLVPAVVLQAKTGTANAARPNWERNFLRDNSEEIMCLEIRMNIY